MKKKLLIGLGALLFIVLIAYAWIINSNNYKRDGQFELTVNDQPIEIHRDENGIAYVIAQNKADVYRGQGFVTAQDRLFQIEFYRALIKGEAAALVGSSMLDSDIQMRVLNLYGNAERSFAFLDEETKQVLQWYCEGFNEYLRVGESEFPIELGLIGIEPQPLQPVDIMSVTHFIGFFHSQNFPDEVLSLNLAARMEKASELLPLAINPERTKPLQQDSLAIQKDSLAQLAFGRPKKSVAPLIPFPKFGSNNWAISGNRSTQGKPIVANDPHVDARVLPGTFYPIGLQCPEFKATGIATPGIPGLLSGRNEFVAFGVTNAYGDSQDLFIEEIQGDRYKDKEESLALRLRKEVIKIKDSTDLELTVRETKRGPIISDFHVFNVLTADDVSLRWSLANTQSTSIGFEKLLDTKNIDEFRTALTGMDNVFFNFVFADVNGGIAHQATGLVPIRANRQGSTAQKGSEGESWLGYIPKNELPHTINPERGWVGTANHDTRPDDYPYYYSDHFSPFYRYKRIGEKLDPERLYEAEELWEFLFDVRNLQAVQLSPIFITALEKQEETRELAQILKDWNKEDDIDQVGASVYNVLYNELLYLMLEDELPNELEEMYWENVYYWNQRLDDMLIKQHPFIDNRGTPEKESVDDLIALAGERTIQILEEKLGENRQDWIWGKLHTVYFYSPIKKEGFGSAWLGAERLPKKGSNQTLNRGGFIKNRDHDFDTSWFSSFRMIADLSDQEKLMGALSGGSAARIFHPYHKSQLEVWKTEQWIPYWLSEEKIREHSEHQLILE